MNDKSAADKAKEAMNKTYNYLKRLGPNKKFTGTGHKLGTAESSLPMDTRPTPQHLRNIPGKSTGSPHARHNAQRNLGFRDPPDVAMTTQPSTAQQGLEKHITDNISIAATSMISCGDEGIAAARTVSSIVSNVLRAPYEAKYRQLNCGNPRVAATLQVPGVKDMLKQLGFKHLQEAANASEPEPGVLSLSLQYPGKLEPLYHGALHVLQQAIAQASVTTSAAPSITTDQPARSPHPHTSDAQVQQQPPTGPSPDSCTHEFDHMRASCSHKSSESIAP